MRNVSPDSDTEPLQQSLYYFSVPLIKLHEGVILQKSLFGFRIPGGESLMAGEAWQPEQEADIFNHEHEAERENKMG